MVIEGKDSAENLSGGAGDDTIVGAGGNDTVHGGGGYDLISGDAGSDLLYGDDGGDILYGGDDLVGDTVNGGTGDDTLLGGPGADSIDGGDGNDLIGVDGGNIALGGAGDDYLQLNESSAGAFGHTVIDGGTGFDLVDLTVYQFGANVWLDQATATGLEVRGAEIVVLNNLANTVHGGAGDDAVQGANGDDRIDGNDGADILDGAAGSNTVNGGAGDDLIFYDGGEDVISGGAGIDVLDLSNRTADISVRLGATGVQNTGWGHLTVSGVEVLAGGDGHEQLGGDAAANTIKGGAGDDVLFGSQGIDLLDGGAGIDAVSFVELASGQVVVDFAQSKVTFGPGNTTTYTGVELVTGTVRNDVFKASAGDDAMSGGGGVDTVTYASAAAGVRVNLNLQGVAQNTGGSGRDTLRDLSVLVGSAFADVLTTTYGDTTIRAGAGDDKLFTGGGFSGYHHELDGGGGIDTVSFVEISDALTMTIDLAQGIATSQNGEVFELKSIERVNGHVGVDFFYASDAGEVIDGGGGAYDEVSYERASAGVRVNLSVTTSQQTGGSGADRLIGISHLDGSAFGDVLIGADGGVVDGRAGNDLIVGVGGGVLAGGVGDDTIVSGDGDDTILGGSGVNTVSYANAKAAVQVDMFYSPRQPHETGGGGRDSFSDIVNVIGSKFGDTLLGAEWENTLAGGKGDDFIDAQEGQDVVDGGAGNDRIIGGWDADLMSGGKGNDVFVYHSADESLAEAPDRITDLKRGDWIDLSALDASPSANGNQAFTLVRAFTGHEGEVMVSYDAAHDTTHIEVDLWGDGFAYMEILVDGDQHAFRGFVL